MNNRKRKMLINILVVCLYFIWPYFLNPFINLFNLSEVLSLFLRFGLNFVFLFVIVYIYRNIIINYFKDFKKNFNKNIKKSIKIFLLGLFGYLVLNYLLYKLGFLAANNTNVMVNIFKKIPLMFILNTLLYYSVIEELVFKLSLKDVIKNKWYFVIITGLLNAFFQIVFSISSATDLLYLLPYTIFFGSLSYVYYETDNIMYPIFLRVCYNLIPCLIYIIDLFY